MGTRTFRLYDPRLSPRIDKKIHGATLSAKPTASAHILDKGIIEDTTYAPDNVTLASVEKKILKRNIEAVAEALTKIMYGISDTKNSVFANGYEGLGSGFMEQVERYLQQTARFPTKLVKGSETMKALGKIISKAMPNATKHTFEYKDMEFFANAQSRMKVIKTKSRLIDMFLFVVIAAYLLVLYAYMTVRTSL